MLQFLNDLNNQQKDAVLATDGPVLILAGAGSGKTRVLTYRIAYILKRKFAYPEEILSVTFTNKASSEMKERIRSLVEPSVHVPWVGTFHSICVRMLRKDGYEIGINPNFTIYDETDQLAAIKESMKKLKIDTRSLNPNIVLSHISSAKNELVTEEAYKSLAKGYFQEQVAIIYKEYQKFLLENQALDFDDILQKAVVLLKKSPRVLDKYQNLFQYIHVDEYQDTNHAQYVFIKLLANKNNNICVVGDDDQSIYSWRGANIKNILSFEKDFSNTKIFKLEQNYRSTKIILKASNSIIKQNKNRKEKELWTTNAKGEKILVYKSINEKDEADFIAEKIEEILKQNISPEEIVVLYRINAQSRIVEETLLEHGLPYRIIGGVRFYDRKEIKDILSFLMIMYNPFDNICLKRIINTPPRGIGEKTFDSLEISASKKGLSIFKYMIDNQKELKDILKNFIDDMIDLTKASEELNIQELIKLVIDKTGYNKWLEQDREQNLGRIENLKELLTIAEEFKDLPPREGLEAFLERASLYKDQDEMKKKDESKITLMTIHAAKGLEYRYVFVIGMEEGIFPHSRAYSDISDMEEERRLAYVAFTRAKERLFLSYATKRLFFGALQKNTVSRFIRDIPEELIEFRNFDDFALDEDESDGFEELNEDKETAIKTQPYKLANGLKVRHNIFGIGTILEFDESIVKIDFGKLGKKELLLEYAKFDIIETKTI